MNDLLDTGKDTSRSCVFDFPDRPVDSLPPDHPVGPPPDLYPYDPVDDWPPPVLPVPGSDPHPTPGPVANPSIVDGDVILFKLIPVTLPDSDEFAHGFGILPLNSSPFAAYSYETALGAGASLATDAIFGAGSPDYNNITDATVFVLWYLKRLTGDYTGQLKVYNPHEGLINFHLEFSAYKFHGAVTENRPNPVKRYGFWDVSAVDSVREFYHDFTFPAGPYPPSATLIFANFTYHQATGKTNFTWLI